MVWPLPIDTLLEREDERAEWKKGVADTEQVVETIAAFANDYGRAGGGAVVCGVEEVPDAHGFTQANKVGLTGADVAKLKNEILSKCQKQIDPPLTPGVREEAVPNEPGRKLLVFDVRASDRVHWVRSKRGKNVFYRAQDQTHQAPPKTITELMRDKGGVFPPFLDEVCAGATMADLDHVLVEETLAQFDLQHGTDHYLTPGVRLDSRTPPLVRDQNGTAVPTRLAIVLFGRDPTRFVRGVGVVMAVYDGAQRSAKRSQRYDLFERPILRLIDDVLIKLDDHNPYDIDKSPPSGAPATRRIYSKRALREAVVNAVVHRDYAATEPIRIDIFPDRLEITSPGGLMRDLESEKVIAGNSSPSWRNVSLVSFLVKLNQAENLGQGLRTMIDESIAASGKRPDINVEHSRFQEEPAERTRVREQAPQPTTPHRAGDHNQGDAV